MRFSKFLMAAPAVLLLAAFQANAAPMTDDVSFSATGFTAFPGGTAPVDPVTGSFTITLDPALNYSDDTADITLTSLNIALDLLLPSLIMVRPQRPQQVFLWVSLLLAASRMRGATAGILVRSAFNTLRQPMTLLSKLAILQPLRHSYNYCTLRYPPATTNSTPPAALAVLLRSRPW